MHESVMAWVASYVTEIAEPILEAGSYDVNGTVRVLCPADYTGIDIVAGPGVDLVYDGETIPFPDAAFATVLSTEVFEHVHRPWTLADEIVRVLRPGGLALITARGNGFSFHNPPDRWRYMPGALAELFADRGCTTSEITDPQVPGVFVYARKAT